MIPLCTACTAVAGHSFAICIRSLISATEHPASRTVHVRFARRTHTVNDRGAMHRFSLIAACGSPAC